MNIESLGAAHPRDVFIQLNEEPAALEEFSKAFSKISQSDGWAVYSPLVQNQIVVLLLAATLNSARITIGDLFGDRLADYETYIKQSFSVRCRFTSSRDALKLRQLRRNEAAAARRASVARNDSALKEILDLAWREPTLLVIANIGLVYWDPCCGELGLRLTKTAVEVPLDSVESYAKADNTSQYRSKLSIAAIGERRQRDALKSIVQSTAEHSGCKKLVEVLSGERE